MSNRQKLITLLVSRHRRRNPIRNHRYAAQVEGLRGQKIGRYMRNWLCQHGALPTGVHKVGQHMLIDFDALMRPDHVPPPVREPEPIA